MTHGVTILWRKKNSTCESLASAFASVVGRPLISKCTSLSQPVCGCVNIVVTPTSSPTSQTLPQQIKVLLRTGLEKVVIAAAVSHRRLIVYWK